MVKSGQSWSGVFVALDATGALSAATTGPVGALYVDGTVNGATVTISGSNPYKWSVTLPTLTAGQCVSMYITATIATIATASVVAEDVADTVMLSDVPAVNVTMQAGVAVAAADANGNVPVVLYGTQPAVTFGQVKIAANVSGQGALHIVNSHASGHGQLNSGGLTGVRNQGAVGQFNSGSDGPGQWNDGTVVGQQNQGAVGQTNTGLTPVSGVDEAGIRAALGMAAADLDAQLDAIGGLTAQGVADALLLAPAGVAAAGSAMDYLADTPANVWAYPTRTLTQSSTSTTDSTAAGSIARRRGDSWSISLTVGAITGYTSLWFTAKWDRDNTDAQAVLQIKLNASGLNDGLLYVNGAAATDDTLASITVSDASTGAIVIAVDETVTDDLPPAGIYYDVQALVSGTVSTLDSGTLTISADVTRAVA